MIARAFVLALALAICARPARALPRSKAARAEFMRAHPCPANGHTCGSCPGWQMDHVQPLKCGIADQQSNMQWLTVADHLAKTKAEAKDCRVRRRAAS